MAYVSSKKKLAVAAPVAAPAAAPGGVNGIHLRHKVIQQISGPSMILLVYPYMKDFQDHLAQGVSLPIVLFMGESHDTFYECDPCEEEKGCYSMRETSLFRLLNDLATLTPIDIHVETNPYSIQPYLGEFGKESNGTDPPGISKSTVRNMSKRLYPTCFGPNKGADCVTPYLRFHYVDARIFHHTIEFYTMAPTMFTLMKMEYVLKSGAHKLNTISSYFPSWTRRNPLAVYAHELVTMIFKGLLVPKDTPQELFERVYDRLFQIMDDVPLKQSSIQKQLRKLPERFQDKAFWMTGLRNAWSATISIYLASILPYWEELRKDEMEKERVILHRILTNMIALDQNIEPLDEEEYRILNKHIIHVTGFFIYLTNHILDLYSITRMIKPPTGGVGPTFVVHFAGMNHSKMMFVFLHYLFKYQNAFMDGVKASVSQCTTINKYIPLEEIIMEYHAERFPAGGTELDSYKRWVQRTTLMVQQKALKRKANAANVANAANATKKTHAKAPRSARGGHRRYAISRKR